MSIIQEQSNWSSSSVIYSTYISLKYKFQKLVFFNGWSSQSSHNIIYLRQILIMLDNINIDFSLNTVDHITVNINVLIINVLI